ncbi:unnamed protein product [Gordionus sp. m RMFG-2023]
MSSLILGKRTRRNRSVRIKGQTLTIEGNNREEDVMGKVTWLPVQELIRTVLISDNKHTDNTNHPDLLNFSDSGANYDAESPIGKKVMLPKSSDIKLEEATQKDIPGSSKNTSEKKG